MTDLSGKAIVITGASSGIGRTLAIALGAAGADLWLLGRSSAELATTATMVKEAGGKVPTIRAADLQERGHLRRLIGEVSSSHPHLFAVINNAGLMHPEPIMQGTEERWQAMLAVNAMAVLEGSQAGVQAMRAHGRPGHIVNIGSIAARWEEPGVYGATKKMVEGIGATLRRELERDPIRVTSIIPGGFATQLARGLKPEQLAQIGRNFAELGIDMNSPDLAQVIGDPRHVANAVLYVLAQPVELNIQEIVIRPPVDTKI